MYAKYIIILLLTMQERFKTLYYDHAWQFKRITEHRLYHFSHKNRYISLRSSSTFSLSFQYAVIWRFETPVQNHSRVAIATDTPRRKRISGTVGSPALHRLK